MLAHLTTLVGPVQIRDDGVYPCAPGYLSASLSDPVVGVVLVGPRNSRLVLEFAPELALALLERVVGGEGQPRAATGPLTDVERGILLYAVARTLASTPWRAGAVLTSPLALAAVVGDEGSAAWSATLTCGPTHGVARIWIPDRFELVKAPPRPLRGLKLDLCLSAGEAELPASELTSLRTGDVVVLDACWWHTDRRLRARAIGGTRTSWWCDEDLRITEVETGPGAPTGKGRVMSEPQDRSHETEVISHVGDVPVMLSVEIARLTVPVEEVASLREGEVLATGVPIGGRVVLRAGEEVVGEGELVDIEGEIGVRLLALR